MTYDWRQNVKQEFWHWKPKLKLIRASATSVDDDWPKQTFTRYAIPGKTQINMNATKSIMY